MRVDYSMFEGFQVKGNARTVMSRGEVIVDRGEWVRQVRAAGQYLKRQARGGALEVSCTTQPVQRRPRARSRSRNAPGASTTTRRSGWR